MSTHRTLLSVFILFVSVDIAHAACQLPAGRKIRIGCTNGCGCTSPKCVGPTLKLAAKSMGLPDDAIEFPDMDKKDVDGSLNKVDTILSGGGHDFNPKYVKRQSSEAQAQAQTDFAKYGNMNKDGLPQPETDTEKTRDEFESAIMDRYLAPDSPYGDKPLLGICYGMQMLAARSGIPMVQDLPAQKGISDSKWAYNNVNVSGGSQLFRYVPGGPSSSDTAVAFFENHHQGVDIQYYNANKSNFPNVKFTGTSHGGRVGEIIEVGKNAIGVQFHAEHHDDSDPTHLTPFKWFLNKACESINKTKPAAPAPPKGTGSTGISI